MTWQRLCRCCGAQVTARGWMRSALPRVAKHSSPWLLHTPLLALQGCVVQQLLAHVCTAWESRAQLPVSFRRHAAHFAHVACCLLLLCCMTGFCWRTKQWSLRETPAGRRPCTWPRAAVTQVPTSSQTQVCLCVGLCLCVCVCVCALLCVCVLLSEQG